MLKDIGATYVLCGHSERRTLFGDDDFAINRKVKKILKEDLIPVLCCGETQEEYEAGYNYYYNYYYYNNNYYYNYYYY